MLSTFSEQYLTICSSVTCLTPTTGSVNLLYTSTVSYTHLPSGAYVIAADAGYNRLRDFGVRPDLAVGDFDSMGAPPDDVPVVRHPAEKDDTDMLLAVREGFARGFSRCYLFGGTGGRIDHTLANLQTLAFIAERGGVGFLFGDDWTAAAVKNGTLGFPAGLSGTVSVFALGSPAPVSYTHRTGSSRRRRAAARCLTSISTTSTRCAGCSARRRRFPSARGRCSPRAPTDVYKRQWPYRRRCGFRCSPRGWRPCPSFFRGWLQVLLMISFPLTLSVCIMIYYFAFYPAHPYCSRR